MTGKRNSTGSIFKNGIISLIVTVVSIALFKFIPLFEILELQMFDQLMRLKRNIKPHPGVVIVQIDDASHNQFGWPIPRGVIAQCIDSLDAYGARCIAVDLLFDTPHREIDEDRQLGLATLNTDQTVHTFVAEVWTGNNRIAPDDITLDSGHIQKYAIEPDGIQKLALPEAQVIQAFHPAFQSVFHSAGAACLIKDQDGHFRSYPLTISYQDVVYPSLALQSILKYLGHSDRQIEIKSSGPSHRMKIGRDVNIPVSKSGELLIHHYGDLSAFTSYSIRNIIVGKVPVDAIRDRLVIIGSTATGDKDSFVTPFSTDYPGVGMHAAVLSNVLNQDYIRQIPMWLSLICLFICSFGILFMMRMVDSSWLPYVQVVIALILLAFISLFLMSQFLVWIPVTLYSGSLILSLIGSLSFFHSPVKNLDTDQPAVAPIQSDGDKANLGEIQKIELFVQDRDVVIHGPRCESVKIHFTETQIALLLYLAFAKTESKDIYDQRAWVKKGGLVHYNAAQRAMGEVFRNFYFGDQSEYHADNKTKFKWEEDIVLTFYKNPNGTRESDAQTVRRHVSKINTRAKQAVHLKGNLITSSKDENNRGAGYFYLKMEEVIIHLPADQ